MAGTGTSRGRWFTRSISAAPAAANSAAAMVAVRGVAARSMAARAYKADVSVGEVGRTH